MHFNESVRISDGVRLNHPNIRRSPVTQPTLLCLFVIDFSVDRTAARSLARWHCGCSFVIAVSSRMKLEEGRLKKA